ncbi:alkaline phosphatase family protein [Aestuariirhabdus sp. Z084]|uniref:alkaline phosphatase family protein n=1 Tax=Aestuariirhabdus haliotis TaxID=2918751 RepID=UPI00201B39AA|nr:alkaline phosphatase family protein [Aestuariirhabdus haliotis]MCL6416832.1 alkaline phosphatase family protein [Aestuariirhabdus haliotis]MCL6420832.1 alkaline phosphatase family protein [Aestuariirhabdus haliotis]
MHSILNARSLLRASLLCGLLPFAGTASSDIGSTPVVGAAYNTSKILKEQIFGGVEATVSTGRDVALFTIAGMSLDAYILTLPLEADVKARVISRLSNPVYSIQLGHFLYLFYDQYGGLDGEDRFRQYLLQTYTTEQLQQWEHSLFSLADPVADDAEAADGAEQSMLNSQFIAALVTVYDVLFNNDEWLLGRKLPEQYSYLSRSPEDLALIAKIQTIVLDVMSRYAEGLDADEMKTALEGIVQEGQNPGSPEVNSKAQAITITLIDFVRLNVLKAYRQFARKEARTEAFGQWMQNTFDDNPQSLIHFLEQQSSKRFAVQITVDGLQQGLMAALADEQKSPLLSAVYDRARNKEAYRPDNETVASPEHVPKHDFLLKLIEDKQSAMDDPAYLPFFKTLYQQSSKGIARFGVSSTPTISVRNLPIIKTGATVAGNGGTGIPNFHFVDRDKDRAYYFFGNDALQLDRLAASRGMQTMFDRLDYLKTLNCNAQYDWNALTAYDGLVNLGLGEAVRDFGESRCMREIQRRAEVEPRVQQARQQLIEDIQAFQEISAWSPLTRWTKKKTIEDAIQQLAALDTQGMPDYVLVYNPWPDHFAHFKGAFSDEIIAPTGELNRLDYWISELTQAYKNAGIYDNTLWGMAGDHGLAPVYFALNPEKQALDYLEKDYDVDLDIRKISSDEGEGFKITNALNPPSFKGADVVVASTAGGNFMMDFFNSGRGWKVQPLYSEMIDYDLPSNKQGVVQSVDMVEELSSRLKESLDYLVLRESDCSIERCTLRLVGHRDGQRVDEIIQREGDRVLYAQSTQDPMFIRPLNSWQVAQAGTLLELQQANPFAAPLTAQESFEKEDLLQRCLQQPVLDQPDSWCSEAQWRQLTRLTPRPDSVNQLAHLYDESRAGTINLFPGEGIGFNTIVPGRHAGEHYLEKDAFVGFWGKPSQAVEQMESVDNGSLAPTLYEFLTGERVVVGEAGWGYPSLLPQLLLDETRQQ